MSRNLTTESLEKNVRLFVWFRVLFNARFYYPIFAVFFTDMGLSVSQFLWLNALWAVTIVLFELPSGVLADLVGRRKLVVFSAVSMLVEMLLLAFAPIGAGWGLFAICAVNRVLSGLAEAAASGADEALAYDSVKLLHEDEKERESRWDQTLVAAMRWRSLAMVGAMLVGGFVFDHAKMVQVFGDFPAWISLKLPVILCVITAVICVVLSLRLTDLGLQRKSEGERTHVRDIWKGIVDALNWVRTCQWIAAIILGGVIIDAVARTFVTLQSTYFRYIDLPEYTFGIIGGAMSLTGWVVPLYIQKVTQRFSPRGNFFLTGLMSLAGLAGIALFDNAWGIVPSLLIMMSMMQVGFLLSRYVNQSAPSEQRASILSVNSLSLNLGYGAFSLVIGLVMSKNAKIVGSDEAFANALQWMAVGFAIGLTAWYVCSIPFRRKQI